MRRYATRSMSTMTIHSTMREEHREPAIQVLVEDERRRYCRAIRRQCARPPVSPRGHLAPAKNPSFGSALKIFCTAAVVVTMASHASGTNVTSACGNCRS